MNSEDSKAPRDEGGSGDAVVVVVKVAFGAALRRVSFDVAPTATTVGVEVGGASSSPPSSPLLERLRVACARAHRLNCDSSSVARVELRRHCDDSVLRNDDDAWHALLPKDATPPRLVMTILPRQSQTTRKSLSVEQSLDLPPYDPATAPAQPVLDNKAAIVPRTVNEVQYYRMIIQSAVEQGLRSVGATHQAAMEELQLHRALLVSAIEDRLFFSSSTSSQSSSSSSYTNNSTSWIGRHQDTINAFLSHVQTGATHAQRAAKDVADRVLSHRISQATQLLAEDIARYVTTSPRPAAKTTSTTTTAAANTASSSSSSAPYPPYWMEGAPMVGAFPSYFSSSNQPSSSATSQGRDDRSHDYYDQQPFQIPREVHEGVRSILGVVGAVVSGAGKLLIDLGSQMQSATTSLEDPFSGVDIRNSSDGGASDVEEDDDNDNDNDEEDDTPLHRHRSSQPVEEDGEISMTSVRDILADDDDASAAAGGEDAAARTGSVLVTGVSELDFLAASNTSAMALQHSIAHDPEEEDVRRETMVPTVEETESEADMHPASQDGQLEDIVFSDSGAPSAPSSSSPSDDDEGQHREGGDNDEWERIGEERWDHRSETDGSGDDADEGLKSSTLIFPVL